MSIAGMPTGHMLLSICRYCFFALILLMFACSQGYVSMADGGEDDSGALTDNQRRSGDAKLSVVAQGMYQLQSCDEGKSESFPIQASHRGLLDILVVIDSNVGTDKRREQAAERMRPLIEKLGDSDYQVAIISGKLDACIEKVITKSTPNAIEALVSAIKTGPTVSGEYVNMKAITGLTSSKFDKWSRNSQSVVNAGGHCSENWIRDNSVVAIIVISGNEHLCCHPYACTMLDIENSLKEKNRLSNTSSQRKLYRLYGLLNQSNEYTRRPSSYLDGNDWYVDWRDFEEYNISGTTTRLADFVKSIDDPDYDEIFNSITDDLATSLGDTFTLAETHDNMCAHVSLITNGTAQTLSDSEYEIVGKTLKIKRVLTEEDTEVSISYSY